MKYYHALFNMVREGPTNKWIETESAKVYVRTSRRRLGLEIVPCIDLANVEVKPQYQGRGVFVSMLEEFEMFCTNDRQYRHLFIENVLTDRFAQFFDKRGYARHDTSGLVLAPCFWQYFRQPALA